MGNRAGDIGFEGIDLGLVRSRNLPSLAHEGMTKRITN